MLAFATFLSALLLAGSAQGQVTTTLPWLNGDTVVVSPSTNPINGVVQTVTISTIAAGAGGVTTTPGVGGVGVTPTSSTTSTTRTRTTTTPAGGAGAQTTATQRVVGQETSYPPMQTTTYGYPNQNGDWVTATWTASVTGAPSVATAIVPAGTIQDYAAYQSAVNKVLYSSAVAADESAQVAANGTVILKGGAARRIPMGWASIGLAAGGAVVGGLML